MTKRCWTIRNLACMFAIVSIAALVTFTAMPARAFAQDGDRTVWVSKTGVKYHYVQDCSGMKNPLEMTLSAAIASGRNPCSNCVRESSGGSTGSGGSGPVSGNRVDPFVDIYTDTAHEADISWLYRIGISTGWPAAGGLVEFAPFETVKRADMAAFLFRLAGSPSDYEAPALSPFSDVSTATSHYKEICWLAESGISTGWIEADGTKTFRPFSDAARADVSAFLKRLAAYLGADVYGMAVNPFSDVSTQTPHRDEILWMVCAEISTGWTMEDGSREFRPYAPIVRADMAAFLHRLYNWCP